MVPRIVPRTTNTMLGLMQYPQRVLLRKQQKGPRTFLAILKYVAAQQPTDRQFRYSNRPIRCLRNSVDTTAAITNKARRLRSRIVVVFIHSPTHRSLLVLVLLCVLRTAAVPCRLCSARFLLWSGRKNKYGIIIRAKSKQAYCAEMVLGSFFFSLV